MEVYIYLFLFAVSIILVSIPIGWISGIIVKKLMISNSQLSIKSQNTIYSEYNPPLNLKPAEIAFLYDKSFGKEELLATLFNLEQRGMVNLSKVNPVISDSNFRIILNTEPMNKKLDEFEQEILLSIKSLKSDNTWSNLRNDTEIWDSAIENKIEFALSAKGLFLYPASRSETVKKFFIIGGIIAFLCMFLITTFFNITVLDTSSTDVYKDLKNDITIFVIFIYWLLLSCVFGIATYYGMSSYRNALDISKGTLLLKKIWPHIEGFKEYLEVVEQDKIKFENETLKVDARQHALPYAVALGMRTNWESRFR
jgi:hypothetical protein